MVKGIGVDIVDVSRFEGVLERHGKRFMERIFTPGEMDYCEGKYRPAMHYAARFAAKEAVIKALGKRIPFKNVEIVRGESGKPGLDVKGYTAEMGYIWHLSISHDGGYSLASVILEERDEGR